MAYKCHWCQYRHGGCPYDYDDKISDNCKESLKSVAVIHVNITMVRMENWTNRKQISGLLVDVRYGVLHHCGVVRGNGCQENERRD